MFPDLHNALSNACEAAGLRKKPEDGQESGSGYSPLNDPSPNCSSPRPSGLLDDNSYEHWLIILNSQNAQNIWKKK
ncbi:hypothetical protein Goklo_001870 [Gossypium klotzschianum]|uniref:Uncharacterized protein n=1 Tax=Gossypium klotzschianum TaxID=34286 RepID=A0A7J8W1V3_9ROSI|nr:hypothetical protein [Gossypium klotzschianum]